LTKTIKTYKSDYFILKNNLFSHLYLLMDSKVYAQLSPSLVGHEKYIIRFNQKFILAKK